MFVPSARAAGSNVTVSVTGSAPIVPLDGSTVMYGLSPRAVNVVGGACPGSTIFWMMPFFTPTSADVCRDVFAAGGSTTVETIREKWLFESSQSLSARTR